MNRYAVVSAAALSAALLAALAGQAHAQAVVEDPGYCAQYYPNSNCTNYGPGNPLYPGSYKPSGPAGNYPSPYASAVPYAAGGPVIVHHHHRHRAYR